ncbi:hypothetical protein JW707_02000 [Candidatus Woesearchaeota archaeon]|nr:hypothetical protein [Candidatus Woesearchaeota archaeon]
MNKKFLFAILVAIMLLASGCISIAKYSDNASEADEIEAELEDVAEDVETAEEIGEDIQAEAPEDESLPTKTVVEGELVDFPNLNAVDPDGDAITYTFTEPLDKDGKWKTKVGDAGKYKVTITASDGVTEVSQDVMVIVKALNNAPVMASLDDITVDEGDTVEIDVEVSDADGDDVDVEFSGWMKSESKVTGYNDAGTHTVTVTASDGKESVVQTVKVTVNDVNRAPKIESLSNVEIDEGEDVEVDVDVSDPDGDDVEVSFSSPLDENGEWETEIGDAGVYTIKVTASDGDLESEETFKLTVAAVNAKPELEGVADIVADEGDRIVLGITATDADGDDVEIEFSEPFDEDGVWQTDYNDEGEYVVTVTATDGLSNVEETFTVTVNDLNRPPVFDEDAFE